MHGVQTQVSEALDRYRHPSSQCDLLQDRMEFNKGPQWMYHIPSQLWAFLESYGWYLVGSLVAIWILVPRVKRQVATVLQAKISDPRRESELDRRKQATIAKRERETEAAKEAWRARKAAADEEHRRKKIEELEAKAARLGIRPKGVGHKLGRAEASSAAAASDAHEREDELLAKAEEDAKRAREESLAKQLAHEEQLRKRKIEELDAKAARLGIRPRGVGRKLGRGDEPDSSGT